MGRALPQNSAPQKITAALAVLPNTQRLQVLRGLEINGSEDDPLDWHGWATIGLATWNGTSGSKEGFFTAFLPWSRKWPKYIAGTEAEKAQFDRNTAERWEAFSKCPPDKIGAGTIFWLADKAAPRWREEYDARKDDGQGGGDAGQQGGPTPQPTALPKLIINSSDPTATAKDLAVLIAKHDDFLFNGHAPV